MNKPQESDYASHVAYARALEVYCEGVEAEIKKAKLHIKHIGNDALRTENAELRTELTSALSREELMIHQCNRVELQRDALRAELDKLKNQEPVVWLRYDSFKVMTDDEKMAGIESGNADSSADYTIPIYLAAGASKP